MAWAAGTDTLCITSREIQISVTLFGLSWRKVVPRDQLQYIAVARSVLPVFPTRFGRPFSLRAVSDTATLEFGVGLSEKKLRRVLARAMAYLSQQA